MQTEIIIAIIAASGTIFVSFITYVISKYYEKKIQLEQEIREKKIPIYEEFIDFMFKLFYLNKTDKNNKPLKSSISPDDLQKFFVKFTQKLILWGADDVIIKWSNYRNALIDPELNKNYKLLFENLESLLLAIRKDIGFKNKNIQKGDVLGLFINEIDKFI